MNNITKLIIFDFKTNKKQIIGWCVSMFSIMFLYMILFPSVEDMAQIKMDSMPQELMQFVGLEEFSDMGNFVQYYAMIYNLILIAISIFAVTFTTKLISGEEKNKTIEFIYSLQIKRSEIYISKVVTSFIALCLLMYSTVISAIICGFINGGETFILADVITITKTSSFSPFIFMGITAMICGAFEKISASSFGSITVILAYILGFLSTMVSNSMQWIKYLSPFEVFNTTGDIELIPATVYAFLLFVFIYIGLHIYKKRDFKI